MYDDVICEQPLPDGYRSGKGFQTKDFDCILATLIITADGRLLQRLSWDDEEPQRDLNFHGTMHFYGYDKEKAGPPASPHNPDLWHQYEARFTDGKLVEITVYKPPPRLTPEPGS